MVFLFLVFVFWSLVLRYFMYFNMIRGDLIFFTMICADLISFTMISREYTCSPSQYTPARVNLTMICAEIFLEL